MAEDVGNTRDPQRVRLAHMIDSRWRNRMEFADVRAEIKAFLTGKWQRERDYRTEASRSSPPARTNAELHSRMPVVLGGRQFDHPGHGPVCGSRDPHDPRSLRRRRLGAVKGL